MRPVKESRHRIGGEDVRRTGLSGLSARPEGHGATHLLEQICGSRGECHHAVRSERASPEATVARQRLMQDHRQAGGEGFGTGTAAGLVDQHAGAGEQSRQIVTPSQRRTSRYGRDVGS
jgi:hypothetical protein